MTDKSSVYISEDYTVWGSSDSINKLTDHVDDLEGQIESLKASELAHRLLYERAIDRIAVLVEALEKSAQLVDHILKEGGGTYGDAIRHLAAVKGEITFRLPMREADKSVKVEK